MGTRYATESDCDRIKAIAERSFRASYALSPEDIEGIVEQEFAVETMASRLEDEQENVVIVAEQDDSILGFAEARVTNDDRGEVVWLHVDPPERGNGAGTELFERAVAELRERSVAAVRATVLAQNQEGGEFFENFGFETTDQIEREFGSKTLHMDVFRDTRSEHTADDDVVHDDEEVIVDGEPRYIDSDASIPGDEAPFLIVFQEPQREERYGFYCANCGSVTDSVDGVGNVVCDNCGNVHRPDEWDSSYS